MKKSFSFMFFSLFLFAFNAPYSLKKFHAVLDVSKLQAPRSEYNPLYSRKYGDFKLYANRFFIYRTINIWSFICAEITTEVNLDLKTYGKQIQKVKNILKRK